MRSCCNVDSTPLLKNDFQWRQNIEMEFPYMSIQYVIPLPPTCQFYMTKLPHKVCFLCRVVSVNPLQKLQHHSIVNGSLLNSGDKRRDGELDGLAASTERDAISQCDMSFRDQPHPDIRNQQSDIPSFGNQGSRSDLIYWLRIAYGKTNDFTYKLPY